MGFWRNVDKYLKFLGRSRKELAFAIGMKEQTVDRAIFRDSEPKLMDGLKISSYFNIPVEQLLDTPIISNSTNKDATENDIDKELNIYRKHHRLINICEKLDDNDRENVNSYAEFLAEKTNNYKHNK